MTSYTPVPLVFNYVKPEGGANEKPPIIFVHGATVSKEHWDDVPQIAANATKRKVYVIDARNHGDSGWSDTFNFDCNVDDLLHFMDSIKAPKAIIVGHSMGGYTAIKAALRAPERVEKLVVEDMYVKRIPQQTLDGVLMCISLNNAAIQEVPVGADEDTAKQFIIDYFCNGLPEEMRKLIKRRPTEVQIKRTPDGRYVYKANMTALENAMKNADDLMSENKGIFQGPASFIYGKLSAFLVGEEEHDIRKFFPNAEFVGIENATHTVHTDCPAEFKESLLKFLLKE